MRKGQHYISKAYYGDFSIKSKIYAIKKEDLNEKEYVNIVNNKLFKERNFFDLNLPYFEENNSEDNCFKTTIEDGFRPFYEKISSIKYLDKNFGKELLSFKSNQTEYNYSTEKYIFLLLFNFLYRTKKAKEDISNSLKKIGEENHLDEVLSFLYHNSCEDKKNILINNNSNIIPIIKRILPFLRDKDDLKEYSVNLLFIDDNSENVFFTSDNPIFHFRVLRDSLFENENDDVRDIVCFFPITEKKGLLLSLKNKNNEFIKLNKDAVDYFNYLTIINAENNIYMKSNNRNIEEIFTKYKKFENEINSDIVGAINLEKKIGKKPFQLNNSFDKEDHINLTNFLEANYSKKEISQMDLNIKSKNIKHYKEKYWIVNIEKRGKENEYFYIKCFFNKFFKIDEEVN